MNASTIPLRSLAALVSVAATLMLIGCDNSASARPGSNQPHSTSTPSNDQTARSLPRTVDNYDIPLKGLTEMGWEVVLNEAAARDYYHKDKLEENLRSGLMKHNPPFKMLTLDEYRRREAEGARLPILQLIIEVQPNPTGELIALSIRLRVQEFATTARQPDIAILSTVWNESKFGFESRARAQETLNSTIGAVMDTFLDKLFAENSKG